MWTFFIALAILFGGYLIYSRVSEKIFAIDNRLTPAVDHPDGVDVQPLSKWKAFLIELLNIAGTGPIFGAISGALFGPIVFIWIVLGCILGGAVHDYFSGMISSRNNGESIAQISGKYGGKIIKITSRIFSIILLILVTAVFVVSPSSLLEQLTSGNVKAWIWMIIILAYYLLSTIVPIDKIIGKAYPVFGIILVTMALAIIGGIIFQQDKYPMLELIGHFKDYSSINGDLPWWPFMFTTVACGAVSGFHATQSPIVAKCIKSEKEGRQIFYGAMIAEGIIALIWAAAAMAFYHTDTADGFANLFNLGGGNSLSVKQMAETILGPVGTVLAIVGVVICPITSGDTALRSCRLLIAEAFHVNQKKLKNRLLITLPLFAAVVGVSIWNFANPTNFNKLWRWFAWSNQVIAAFTLWIITIYLVKDGKYKYGSLISSLPATFMSAVTITYIFGEPNMALGVFIPMNIAYIIGGVIAGIQFIIYLIYLFKKRGFIGNNKAKIIKTNRLLLRKFEINDAEKMFNNWANDSEVTKYMTWNPHQNIEETKAIINHWLEEYKDPKTYRFAITLYDTNELIGSIDVVDYVDGNPEIGYCLSKAYWNQGYMSEALNAFISHLFDEGFTTIVIEADINNIASNRVIEKCGFKFTHKEEKEHCSIFKNEPVTVNWYKIEK